MTIGSQLRKQSPASDFSRRDLPSGETGVLHITFLRAQGQKKILTTNFMKLVLAWAKVEVDTSPSATLPKNTFNLFLTLTLNGDFFT